MKKKILSLILVLMLLPIASLFVACGKDKSYNLNALDEDFNQIVEKNNNVKNDEGKFVFDYSNHSNLETIIANTAPYNELENYNFVFYNLMSFAYDYVPMCANNHLTNNAEIKNQVKNDLSALKKSVSDVNECVNMFAESVIMADDEEITSSVCLTKFENLIATYEDMFEKATNFNNSLSNLYFNYALKDGNPNVYSLGVENFDANIVVNKLKARIKYQISCLSQCFVEMYVDGDLDERITNKETIFDLTQFNYKNNIEAIDKSFTEQTAAEKANHKDNKSNFYELSVQAQNIQSTIDNDINKFMTACQKIDYGMVVDSSTATALEKMCVAIIESNYNLICNYNIVLVEMLNIVAD